MKTKLQITAWVLALSVIIGSCQKNVVSIDDSTKSSGDSGSSAALLAGLSNVYVYPNNKKTINPKVYGINNEWRNYTSAQFPTFKTRLDSLGCTLLRFPGGWESEHYDWATNTTPGWSKAPAQPGATPAQAKNAMAHSTFVLRTTPYMDNPTTANLNLLKEEAYNLVLQHSAIVKSWEIGNEWWLQWAGGVDRATKLNRYATIARAIAQRIKDANSNVEVYVTGQWQTPSDFSTIKSVFDSNGTWGNVDGLDVHVYAGDNGDATDYHNISANFAQMLSLTGKSKIIASEWSATKSNSIGNKRGLRSANNMILIMHNMIRSGLTSANYWPAPNEAYGIGLLDVTYPAYTILSVGQAFRWMSKNMKDSQISSSGDVEIAASNNVVDKEITLLIPTKELSDHQIKFHFSSTNITSVVSAQAMYMTNPDAPASVATIANITVDNFDNTNNKVTVTANPLNGQGLPTRGPSYEIIKLVLKYQ